MLQRCLGGEAPPQPGECLSHPIPLSFQLPVLIPQTQAWAAPAPSLTSVPSYLRPLPQYRTVDHPAQNFTLGVQFDAGQAFPLSLGWRV